MATANQKQTRLFRALIAKLEPAMRRAFEQATRDLRDGVDWSALIASLTANDIDGAIRSLNIEPAAFHVYSEEIKRTFAASGTLAATTVNPPAGTKISFRFDMANESAEAWIRRNVGDRIVREVDDTVYAVRTTILQGYARGAHPNVIARDVAGRMVNGHRVGGVLGLDPHRSSHVDRMRARLLSGDPQEMRKIFGMTLRDRRLDARLARAIDNGTKLSAEDIELMTSRYADRLLKRRAQDVARTETGMAVMGGRAEEWNQALGKLGKPPEAVIKTWRHGGGVKDPRPHHEALNGTSVRGLHATFDVGGTPMEHALDAAGGANECANCTCDTTFRIDHAWGLT